MVWTAAMYPSLAEMDQLAARIGLSERQVRMWFYHRRMKYKKEGSRNKSLTVSNKKRRMTTYSSDDDSEPDTESDADQLGRVSPGEFVEPSNATGMFCWCICNNILFCVEYIGNIRRVLYVETIRLCLVEVNRMEWKRFAFISPTLPKP